MRWPRAYSRAALHAERRTHPPALPHRYTRITGKTLDLSSAPMVQTAKE